MLEEPYLEQKNISRSVASRSWREHYCHVSCGAKSPLQSLPLVSAAFRCGVEASPVEREDHELTHSFTHTQGINN